MYALPVGFVAIATMLLAIAAASDVRHRKIPNYLVAAVASTGLLAQILARDWMALLSGLASFVIIIALLWRPWMKGMLGGGDVKIAAGAAAWVGLPLLCEYVAATSIAGALVALVCYAGSTRAARAQIRSNLRVATATLTVPDAPMRSVDGRMSVPYGVAVALGAAFVLFWGKRWLTG